MKPKLTLFAVAALLLFAIAAAHADITIKSTVTSKGLVGLTNMEGTQTQMISGDKAKTASSMKMTSKVMKFMGAGKPQESAEITRLDKELFWDVNLKDQEYKERTFADVRAEMEKALKDADKEKAKYAKEHPEDTVKFRTDVKVDKTGKTQKITGYNTEETIITMIMYAKNAESGEQGAMKMTMDLWMAKNVPGAADFQKFYADMAAKLGFTGHSQQSMEGMLTAFGVDPRELYKHTKDLQGMALMSTVALATMADTSAQTGKQSEAKEQKKEKDSDQADEGGKSSTAKKLGGLFGKKKESKDDKASESKDTKSEKQSGPAYLMQFTTTVTEISATSIAGSEFEVPAGFKLKK
jgi:ribosomal protein L12E/L44/L45/RPP1/RPP2